MAMTAAAAIKFMEEPDDRGLIRPLVQLVMSWNCSDDPRGLVAVAPSSTRCELLAMVAAVVHALADRDEVTPPPWVHDHVAPVPTTITGVGLDSPYGRLIAANSPSVSTEHGVYFDAELLERR